jgi:hypothetical protein
MLAALAKKGGARGRGDAEETRWGVWAAMEGEERQI